MGFYNAFTRKVVANASKVWVENLPGAVAPTPGRLDHQDVTGLNCQFDDTGQAFTVAAVSNHIVCAPLSGIPTIHPKRRYKAIVGQDRRLHRFSKFDPAGDTVSAFESPAATAVLPDRKFPYEDRITCFQYLGVGHSGVCHLGVNGICSIKSCTGARSATNSFIILIALIPKCQVVHRAL